MPSVYFFPWLTARKPLDFGPLVLEPYRRGELPLDQSLVAQADMDSLLDFYKNGPGDAVDECVLVRFAGKSIGDEIDDEDRSFLGTFAELICCAYLSERSYFTQDFNYCCKDDFQLQGHGWRDHFDGHVVVSSRRRDGQSLNMTDAEFDAHSRPHNAKFGSTLREPNLFLTALIAASESGSDEWPGVFVGILNFNLANTDSAVVSAEFEMILLYAAFQSSLSLVEDRPRAHADLFRSYLGTTPLGMSDLAPDSNIKERILARYRQGTEKPLAEVWFDDFRAARGHLAHGKGAHNYSAIWSPQNHLVLGSFLFPLLLKKRLASIVAYEWSEQDQADLASFERLIQYDHFDSSWFEDIRDRNKHPWNRIRKETQDAVRSNDVKAFIQAQLDKLEDIE